MNESVKPTDWPAIEPFDEKTLPTFPTAALPPALRDWVEAESIATQTPPDMAALLAMATCGAVIARRVEVTARPGWIEPVNLFVVILLKSGNRKSQVFKDATKPYRDLEAEAIQRARTHVEQKKADRKQLELRRDHLQKQIARDPDPEKRREVREIVDKLAKMPEPVLPRYIVDDITTENLGIYLAEQGGRIACMSAEGGLFDMMAGKFNKNGMVQFDEYLKGHSGDDLITDRVSRKSVQVTRPAVTCALAIQPQVISGLASKPAFRDRGLLARILYAAPQSWIGHRVVATAPVPEHVSSAYRKAIRKLHGDFENIENSSKPFMLHLDEDAESTLQDWEREIETMLRHGGQMETICDWGSKLAGATLRIAAIFHCVQFGKVQCVSRETVQMAIEVARYLMPHAIQVLTFLHVTEDPTECHARDVLKWLLREGKPQFSKREAHQARKGTIPTAEEMSLSLELLAKRGYIRRVHNKEETRGPGRRTELYDVNPELENGHAEKYSQNSQNWSF